MVLTAFIAPTPSYFFWFTPKAKIDKAGEYLSCAIDILWQDASIIDPNELRALRARCDMFVLRVLLKQCNGLTTNQFAFA
jgi:hypothetical protein